MNWNTIRLELAETRDFPMGSVGRGYLIRIPLKNDGSIDEAALAQSPKRATVRRFWSSDPDESGHVVPMDDHLALRLNGDGERLLSLKSRLDSGERVEVIESDGLTLPFRVADVRHLG